MHNAISYHPPTNAHSASPWAMAAPLANSPSFIVEHDAGYGISLWPDWPICPCSVPSQLPVHPSPLAGRAAQETEQSLALCEQCSATTETLMCYQHYSHPKCETQRYARYQEENDPYPIQNLSQPKPYQRKYLMRNSTQSCRLILRYLKSFWKYDVQYYTVGDMDCLQGCKKALNQNDCAAKK